MLILPGATAHAATLSVDGAGGGAYTTVNAAIGASTEGDTIEVRGGTYNEAVSLQGRRNLTLQTAAGADVVFQNSEMPLSVADGYNLTVSGTEGHPLVLRRTTANMLVEGGNQFGPLTMRYVQFDGAVGTVAMSVGGSDPNASALFDHCLFTCTADVCGLVTWWQADVTLNDCTFAMTGNANGVRSTTVLPGKLNVNRCTFIGDKSVDAGTQIVDTAALQFGDPWGTGNWKNQVQEIVATDCTFNGFAWAYEQWSGDLPNNTYGNLKTVRLINPSAGNANESTQIGWAKLWSGENVYIEGKSPQNKSDFRDSTTLIHGVDVRDGGNLVLRDVILKGSAFADPPHSTVNINRYTDFDATVTLERCFLSAASNNFIGNNDNSGEGEGTSQGKVSLNLVNCILEYGDGMINLTGPNSAKLDMKHCTLDNLPGTVDATAIKVGGGTDQITSSYCIFSSDAGSNKFVTDGVGFTGTLNLINHPTQGVTGSVPADTIMGDPLLDGTGHIAENSISGAAAVGSTLNIDFDGNARPMGKTIPDIGADENYAVPVELSSFTLDR